MKAVLYGKLDKPQQAIGSYNSALLYVPLNLRWRFELTKLLVEEEEFEKAHEQIRHILRQKRNHPQALALRKALLAEQAAN